MIQIKNKRYYCYQLITSAWYTLPPTRNEKTWSMSLGQPHKPIYILMQITSTYCMYIQIVYIQVIGSKF